MSSFEHCGRCDLCTGWTPVGEIVAVPYMFRELGDAELVSAAKYWHSKYGTRLWLCEQCCRREDRYLEILRRIQQLGHYEFEWISRNELFRLCDCPPPDEDLLR